MAKIIVRREFPRDPGFRPVQVFFDEVKIDTLEMDQSVEFEAEPGEHTLRVYNTLVSKSFRLNLARDESAVFVTGNAASGCLLAIFGYLGIPAMGVVLERKS